MLNEWERHELRLIEEALERKDARLVNRLHDVSYRRGVRATPRMAAALAACIGTIIVMAAAVAATLVVA